MGSMCWRPGRQETVSLIRCSLVGYTGAKKTADRFEGLSDLGL